MQRCTLIYKTVEPHRSFTASIEGMLGITIDRVCHAYAPVYGNQKSKTTRYSVKLFNKQTSKTYAECELHDSKELGPEWVKLEAPRTLLKHLRKDPERNAAYIKAVKLHIQSNKTPRTKPISLKHAMQLTDLWDHDYETVKLTDDSKNDMLYGIYTVKQIKDLFDVKRTMVHRILPYFIGSDFDGYHFVLRLADVQRTVR